eukprot:TRINITY_DN3115_c0_g2_i1.p1 TRINITY_DN3115_c0_g2~~TRINITY_DN3115_c0_g2_i1.p1  ORF type:complete len:574 (-),score=154.99 TRINITY_DN3115_c0_g2_i1:159-1880(-)
MSKTNSKTNSKKEKTKRVHVLPWLQRVASNPDFEGIELYKDANGSGFRIFDKRKVMRDYSILRTGSPCDDRETYLFFERFDSCVGKHSFKRQGRKTDPELVYILPKEDGFFGADELRLPVKNKRKRTRESRKKSTTSDDNSQARSSASGTTSKTGKKRTSRSGSSSEDGEEGDEEYDILVQGAKRMKLNNGQSMPLKDQMTLFIAVCKSIVTTTGNDAKMQEDALLQAATSAADLAAVTQMVSALKRRSSSTSTTPSSNNGHGNGSGQEQRLIRATNNHHHTVSGMKSKSPQPANSQFVPNHSLPTANMGNYKTSDAMMHQYLASVSENMSHGFKLSFVDSDGHGQNSSSEPQNNGIQQDSMSVESDDQSTGLRNDSSSGSVVSVDTDATQRELMNSSPQMLYQGGYDRKRGQGHQRNLSNSSYSSMLTAASEVSMDISHGATTSHEEGNRFGMSTVSAAAAAAAMMLNESDDFAQHHSHSAGHNTVTKQQPHTGHGHDTMTVDGVIPSMDGRRTSTVNDWQMENLTTSFTSFSTQDGQTQQHNDLQSEQIQCDSIPQMVNMFTYEDFMLGEE